ncbi:integrase catalytic domain-containing protein [Nephila pilipes]|uniref:Integrase catalytic domain-containing protein n=1 Tax=Nephila pilipes TaxID=299642 RepID=A0A8X6MXL8_NEPPI|nr:integrase catalytic domain-containing protein [Nephila pilipes]
MPTDENINKLQRKRSTLRSKVTRLTDGEAKRLVYGIRVICDTYETTKKLLEEKYGNEDRIIQSHLDYLENLKAVQDPSPMELNDRYIECNTRLQALNTLGENTEAYGRILAPKIIRAFPKEIYCRLIIYAKREKLAEENITRLMQFLTEEVRGTVEAQKIRGTLFPDNILKSSMKIFNLDSKVVNKNKKISPFCAFCNRSGHWPQNCEIVTDYETRIQKLKRSNCCFLCTNRGHRITNSPRKSTARCIKCKKQHHISICPPPRNTQLQITNSEVNHINIPKTVFTHLQTACLYVTDPTGITKLIHCILEGGSQASFVDINLIDKLKLNVIKFS